MLADLSALGAASIWALGLGLSCLIGFVIGMAIRPYVMRGVSISYVDVSYFTY